MWPFKFIDEEKDSEIEALTIGLEDCQARLESKNQKQRNVVYDDIDGSTHVFDWATVNAFSIERNMKYEYDELVAYTIIGFIRADGETGEWSFICSQEEHNRLAKDFEEYLVSKRKPATKAKK